jgi:hypothetical protein
MSKVLSASCDAGVVSVAGVPVPGVELLNEGLGSSTGILIVDAERAYYLTNPGNDLDVTLEKVIAALGKVTEGLGKAVDALTAIDTAAYIITVTPGGAGAGGIPSPPVAASDISGITAAAADIDALASELETLKGSLA